MIPKPPEEHKLLPLGMRLLADEMWWEIHAFAYTIIACLVLAVLGIALLAGVEA